MRDFGKLPAQLELDPAGPAQEYPVARINVSSDGVSYQRLHQIAPLDGNDYTGAPVAGFGKLKRANRI